ncbi:MAG TPA: hypothetical protein VJ553_05510 [Candidatus Paceibacterota bacterium]|nr:hypothetical protein [Candidatus Paceibacterota bacterium]
MSAVKFSIFVLNQRPEDSANSPRVDTAIALDILRARISQAWQEAQDDLPLRYRLDNSIQRGLSKIESQLIDAAERVRLGGDFDPDAELKITRRNLRSKPVKVLKKNGFTCEVKVKREDRKKREAKERKARHREIYESRVPRRIKHVLREINDDIMFESKYDSFETEASEDSAF